MTSALMNIQIFADEKQVIKFAWPNNVKIIRLSSAVWF